MRNSTLHFRVLNSTPYDSTMVYSVISRLFVSLSDGISESGFSNNLLIVLEVSHEAQL